ncbi:MAG TPA: M67 family metallopeptidase [Nitrospirota bacterium]|nr:M67 family metallopeptidase [Nitrospirota bacterium]
MTLTFHKTDIQRIFDHCAAGLPNESCGMLAGRDGAVEKVYCMKNAKPGPDYYEMDPEEQFRVMKDIRDAGLQMIGLFHSHPTGQAYPSSVDVAQAYWPGTQLPNYPDAVYVIVSLMDRSRPVVRGFSIEEGKVTEVALHVL